MKKVFIDGSVGTTGLRISERLSERKDIVLLTLDDSERKNTGKRGEKLREADIAFLCLPDAAAVEAVAICEDSGTVIIDASTAHRTLPGWAYGFPELGRDFREKIAISERIAVPGCHASGFASVVYPLIKNGILDSDYPLAAHSVTGYSGGGKSMIASYGNEDRSQQMSSPAQYALGASHKHLPEMKKICSLREAPLFNPIVADFYSGMVVSIPLRTSALHGMKVREIQAFYADFYRDAALVSVLPYMESGVEDGFLYAGELAGKDNMEIIVCGNDDRVTLISRFCNLGKGASGAAVQCMNISMGIDETTGLIF